MGGDDRREQAWAAPSEVSGCGRGQVPLWARMGGSDEDVPGHRRVQPLARTNQDKVGCGRGGHKQETASAVGLAWSGGGCGRGGAGGQGKATGVTDKQKVSRRLVC